MPARQLDIVIDIARGRCDEAAQRLAAGRQQLLEATDQLSQLQGYQQQYIDQSQTDASQGVSVQDLADARRFIGELNTVIHAQQHLVANREREVTVLTEGWVEATRYLQAVERLVALRKRDEAQRLSKQEQQALDDLYAQRKAFEAR